jgi:hypothetical protein
LVAQIALVNIIFQVTGLAGGGGFLQIGQAAGARVTGRTGSGAVLTGQGKGCLGVVEAAETVVTIMTGQAVFPKFEGVGGGEDQVELFVAFGAGALVETGEVLGVAIATGKRDARGTSLMRSEGEAGGGMGEGRRYP